MADILIKPDPADQMATDLYNLRLEGVRLKGSPDIVNPITAELLPNSVIENPVYIQSAEVKVLNDSKMSASSITSLDKTGDVFLGLVLGVQIQLAILLAPQIAQILQESTLGDSTRYQEIKVEDRIKKLEEEYTALLDDTTTEDVTGDIASKVTLSSSKSYE